MPEAPIPGQASKSLLRRKLRTFHRFFADYWRPLLKSPDALVGVTTFILVIAGSSASPVFRARLDGVRNAGISVAALGLTFTLTSMSLLSAMLDRYMVQTLDGLERAKGNRSYGLHGLVVAFRFTATIAAIGILAWFGLGGVANGDFAGFGWILQIMLGGIAAGLTAWLVIGVVQLVGIISTLLLGKAALIRQGAKNEIQRSEDKTA